MATVTETTGDAAPDAGTSYNMAPGDTFTGRLNERFDEDWIRVELQAGLTYEINLAGVGTDGAADTILKIYNSAGQQVAVNDDVDIAAGNLFSMVTFTPDNTGVYYLGAGSYTANPNRENWGDYRITVSNPGGGDTVEEDSGMEDGNSNAGDDNADGNEGGIDDLNNGYHLVIEGNYAVLRGSNGADRLTGSADNDAIYADLGADTIQGGAGNDIVLYVDSHSGVEVRLYDGTARGGHAEGDTFPGRQTIDYRDGINRLRQVEGLDIEGLVGSVHDDILVGAEGSNLLLGGPGNDKLDGREGEDILDGKEGDDLLVGGLGIDLLIGGAGVDTVSYENRSDPSFGILRVDLSTGEARVSHSETDWFPGRQVVEYLDEDGNIQQAEVSDIENLRGSEYGDRVKGAHSPNRLEGLGGDDSLHGLGGDDVLEGGQGDDNLFGGPGDDRLVGGEGDDELTGESGMDELDGGAGDDLVTGGPGADSLRGGPGIDMADYFWESDAGVQINLHTGMAQGGDAEGDRFVGRQVIEYTDSSGSTQQAQISDIENLFGSEHDDVLTGDRGPNELNGAGGSDILEGREGDDRLFGEHSWLSILRRSAPGDDRLSGGEGDDWLEGGSGADQLRGGPGVDTASYRSSGYSPNVIGITGVEVRLYNGTARNEDAEGDTFVGTKTILHNDDEGDRQEITVPDIENLFGSAGNDILAGAHGPNRLDGYLGNDRLIGREGNDWLEGGAGSDLLMGGPGADVLRGGPDVDTASYEFSDGGVVVRLHTVLETGGSGGEAEGDTFNGEIHTLTDGSGTTRELELPDIENLVGTDSNDILAGDFRSNFIWGQAGDDRLYGGPDGGHDFLFGGYGNDQVFGGKGYDRLFGGHGDDLLRGGPDGDYLESELEVLDRERSTEFEIHTRIERFDYGNDRLEGGAGDDYFYFYPDGGNDTILDFGNGEDRIVLKAFEEIQSVTDLATQQQGGNLMIDLSSQGGGTITLQDYSEADLVDEHFVFFTDDTAAAA